MNLPKCEIQSGGGGGFEWSQPFPIYQKMVSFAEKLLIPMGFTRVVSNIVGM